MTNAIETAAAPTGRDERMQALRTILEVLEANPNIPAPDFISFAGRLYAGTEAERFNELHDIAELFGIEVLENARGDRELSGRCGPIALHGHAYADRRTAADAPAPKVVQRPAAVRPELSETSR